MAKQKILRFKPAPRLEQVVGEPSERSFRGKAERGRIDDGLRQLIISSRITILRGSFRLAEETGSSPAPKEQPPRKLSGNKDRKAY